MAAPSPEDIDANETINLLGTALGERLAESRHRFAWSVVTDAYGTTIALVAYPDSARVVIDPFSFVSKRWEGRAPPFFVDTVEQILAHIDQVVG